MTEEEKFLKAFEPMTLKDPYDPEAKEMIIKKKMTYEEVIAQGELEIKCRKEMIKEGRKDIREKKDDIETIRGLIDFHKREIKEWKKIIKDTKSKKK